MINNYCMILVYKQFSLSISQLRIKAAELLGNSEQAVISKQELEKRICIENEKTPVSFAWVAYIWSLDPLLIIVMVYDLKVVPYWCKWYNPV